jgi:hypothetical protein
LGDVREGDGVSAGDGCLHDLSAVGVYFEDQSAGVIEAYFGFESFVAAILRFK